MRNSIHTVMKTVLLIGACGAASLCLGCGSTTVGKMELVQPYTDAPRAGHVYLMRGWIGVFSSGIDEMGEQLRQRDVTAQVFQHDQCEELARTMAERYKGQPDPEPICMIGHSFGSDDSLIIARELDKVGVPVELIITMDAVDQNTVPKNVKLCINYWMPGMLGSWGNFLRGMPLQQEPGGTGKLLNINLNEEGKELKEGFTNHVNIDKGPKLQKAIIDHVLDACPNRATWTTMHPMKHPRSAVSTGLPDDARVAGGANQSAPPRSDAPKVSARGD